MNTKSLRLSKSIMKIFMMSPTYLMPKVRPRNNWQRLEKMAQGIKVHTALTEDLY